MNPFSLGEAAAACGGAYTGDAALLAAPVQDVCIDSRRATPGALYVPIIGQVHDGHAFIDGARRGGALCTLTDRPLPEGPYIRVPDTLEALQKLAAFYRCRFDIPVIGVTGSVGKTSTKEMLAAVLSSRFRTFKTPGNLNNQTGVPLTLFRLEPEHELAIIEMGTNHPGEIRRLSAMAQPTICLITNVGVAHIEFFGTRENIFRGKAEMLEHMRPGGAVIVNGDDDMLARLPGAVRFGFQEHNDVRACEVEDLGLSGSAFTVCAGGERARMQVRAPGRHMIGNALAAVAAGLALGMPLEELREGVERFSPAAGRMQVRRGAHFTVLDDTYNANPTSVMAAIDVLERAPGRRVCVLGDMLELGAQTEEFHEVVGMYAALHGVDLIVCVGTNAEQTFLGAHALAPQRARYFETQETLLSILPLLLRDGDTILVKGSRGMHLEQTVEALLAL